MSSQVTEIAKKHRWSRDLKIYSNKHYRDDNSYYRKVQSNEDVEVAYNCIKNHINTISKMYNLHREDIIDLEKTMARYETAVNKVIAFYDQSMESLYSYTAEELQKMIDNIYKFHDEVENQKMRQAMQD